MMIRSFLVLLSIGLFTSCSDEDEKSCTTCRSEFTQTFELCRESNGTASVDGENTETDYDVYLQGLQETGVVCGE